MEQNQAQDKKVQNSVQNPTVIDSSTETMIHDAQYDYYGKKLATCTGNGQINIYNVSKPENAQKLVTFQAHNGPIWQVSWAHPRFGNILASCGFDKKVAIWKEAKENQWQEIISHKEHTGSVNGIAWAPWEIGLQLAACSSDGMISILARRIDDTWENIFKQEAHEMGVTAISWAPLSNIELFYENNNNNNKDDKQECKLATSSCDNTIKIWKYNIQFTQIQQFDEHSEWVRDVAWNPNLGAIYDLVASCSEDQTVIIRSLDKKNLNKISQKILKFDGPVWHISWSLQGNMISISYAATNNNENICQIYQESSEGDWKLVQIAGAEENQQEKQ